VVNAATPVHGDIGCATADVQENDPGVALLRQQHGRTRGKRLEDDAIWFDACAVHALENICYERRPGSHDMRIHFEAGG